MKYFFLFSFILAFSISANGQLDKNYWLVGGSGSFYSYNDDFTTTGQPTVTGKLTEINLSANVGYFFFDKFAAGLRPGINSIKSHGFNSASVGTEVTKIYIGPFARYYFLNKDKQFNLLIDGSYQFGSYSNFGKGAFQSASVMAGSEVFFNTSVGIEFLVGYLYQKNTKNETQNGYEYMRRGLNISIGFQLHLRKD
ncbi:MAG: hypothetical protein JSS98_06220 [Bacteroidetes bacterium]|nr:hypothetical protein [Bacteroidota bacterium]